MSDQSAQTPQTQEPEKVAIDAQFMVPSLSQEINSLLQENASLRDSSLTARAYVMQLQNEIKQKDEAIDQLSKRLAELEKIAEDHPVNVTNVESVEKPVHNGRVTTKKKEKARA